MKDIGCTEDSATVGSRQKWAEAHIQKLSMHHGEVARLRSVLEDLARRLGVALPPSDMTTGDCEKTPEDLMSQADAITGDISRATAAANSILESITGEF